MPDPVQSKGTNGKSLTYDSAVTAGNFLCVWIATAGNVTGVSDTVNGTWNLLIDEDNNSGVLVFGEIWGKENTAAGTPTVSFTGGFDNFEHMAIAEYAITDSFILDKTASAIDTVDETALDSSNTATTSQNDELLLGLSANDSTRTLAPGTGWNKRFEGTSNSRALSACDKTVSSTGAYNFSGTLSGAANWAACIATIKVSGGGPAPPTPVPTGKRHMGWMQAA